MWFLPYHRLLVIETKIMNAPTIYPKLPPVFKADWLKALRSGDYKQGRGKMLLNNKYCCIGVGCIVLGVPEEKLKDHGFPYDYVDERIPEFFIKRSRNTFMDELGFMNDRNDREHKSFEEIADWIEENL